MTARSRSLEISREGDRAVFVKLLLIGLAFFGGPAELSVAAAVGAAECEAEATLGVDAQGSAPVDCVSAEHCGASIRTVIDYASILVDAVADREHRS